MKKTVFLTAFLLACSPAPPEAESTHSAPHTVTIMTFNVENLFDNDDDEGKDDRTFFALADKQTDEHKKACAEISVKRWR
ncbi:MAG: hypothetical protein IIA12_08050, partial [Proteobacteria bacterium]|nr:hypothetical protein [Pseudomonadota bacterium]